jgi:hypothetical protein
MNLIINYRVIAFIFAMSVFSCGPNQDRRLDESFNGVVIKKLATDPCFGNLVIQHTNIIDTIPNVCICSPEKGRVWNYVIVGDSLSKKAGSLKWIVIRKGIVKTFDYPNCYK